MPTLDPFYVSQPDTYPLGAYEASAILGYSHSHTLYLAKKGLLKFERVRIVGMASLEYRFTLGSVRAFLAAREAKPACGRIRTGLREGTSAKPVLADLATA